ncbi:MAG: DUF2188 domain-containing protein, partial [Chloroflexota bacterium]
MGHGLAVPSRPVWRYRMTQKTQRVTRRADGKWQHKADGNEKATRVTDTQQQAINS